MSLSLSIEQHHLFFIFPQTVVQIIVFILGYKPNAMNLRKLNKQKEPSRFKLRLNVADSF